MKFLVLWLLYFSIPIPFNFKHPGCEWLANSMVQRPAMQDRPKLASFKKEMACTVGCAASSGRIKFQQEANDAKLPKSDRSATSDTGFPRDELREWLGHWKGKCEIQTSGHNSSIEMEIVIDDTNDPSRFVWKVIYVDKQKETRQVRNYLMIYDENKPTKWKLDEQNGVEIPFSKIGKKFLARYSVGDLDMSTQFSLEQSSIHYQIIVSKTTPEIETNGSATSGMKSFRVVSIQNASLDKLVNKND